MNLSDKITSIEELASTLGVTVEDVPKHSNVPAQFWPAGILQILGAEISSLVKNTADQVQWWAIRESLRVDRGLYRVTDVLRRVNAVFPVFAHVSKEDPDMVAYTPDAAAGAADRQIRLSPGKLFSKLFPLVSDHVIRDLVAEHLAEVNQKVEFLQGADIVEAYLTTSAGSCMTKNFSRETHPAQAYDMPHIKMAVLRDKDGVINARCMVYEASETDKRAIRFYGDTKLRHMLSNLGYNLGSWAGCEFKAIRRTDRDDMDRQAWVMPYLDCHGSAASSASGSAVYYYQGRLRAVTPEIHRIIYQANSHFTQCPGTEGIVRIKPVPDDAFTFHDELTDIVYDLLQPENRQRTKRAYYADGRIYKSFEEVADVFEEGGHVCSVTVNSTVQQAICSTSLPIFLHKSVRYHDTPEMRHYCGYVQLDAELYPEMQSSWHSGSAVRLIWRSEELRKQYVQKYGSDVRDSYQVGGLFVDSDDTVSKYLKAVLKSDSVTLIENDVARKIHVRELPAKAIKLHDNGDERGYVAKGSRYLLTRSNRKVHTLFNTNVVKMWDDTYDFERNVMTDYSISGVTYRFSRKDTLNGDARINWIADKRKEAFFKSLQTHLNGSWCENYGEAVYRALVDAFNLCHFTVYSAELRRQYRPNGYGNAISFDYLMRSIKTADEFSAVFDVLVRSGNLGITEFYTTLHELVLQLAEAYAVEYPNHIQPESNDHVEETLALQNADLIPSEPAADSDGASRADDAFTLAA